MSKMGEELDRRLDEAKYDMYEALLSLVGDWVITNGKRVTDNTKRQVYKALAKVEVSNGSK